MLVCLRVLEAQDDWLTQDGHEKILPSIDILKRELQALRNEINSMHDQGKLKEFWQANFLKSMQDLRAAIQQAYTHAYTAGEEYDDNNRQTASEQLHQCHDHIKKAISSILIRHL